MTDHHEETNRMSTTESRDDRMPWDEPATRVVHHGDAPLPPRVRLAEVEAHDEAVAREQRQVGSYGDVDLDVVIDAEVVEDEPTLGIGSIRRIDAADVVGEYVDTSSMALVLCRDLEAEQVVEVDLRRALLQHVREVAAAGRRDRPDLPLSTDLVGPELRVLTSAHRTLSTVASTFKAAADEARVLAGDLVLEVSVDKDEGSIGATSAKVATPDDGAIKVTRTQGSTVSISVEVIVEALADYLTETACALTVDVDPDSYRHGVLDGIAAYRDVAASHQLKSSELGVLADRIAADGTVEAIELATRLRSGFARVSDGKPATVKIEHVAPKGGK